MDLKNGERTSVLGVPIKLSETPGQIRTPPADFGENTLDILRELKFAPDQIELFKDKGVF
jgi:crotonobetainyl-CoA:carnitine CoA-transferase CaiB-like acyl-CoA transferase